MKAITLAILSAVALCAIAASSASAMEFLLNGAVISKETTSKATGEFLIQDLAAPGGVIQLLCSIEILGTWMLRPPFLLNKELMRLTGTGTIVLCSFVQKGACTGETAELAALHLGWSSELIEPTTGVFRLKITEEEGKGSPGWEATCKTILGNIKDSCTGTTSMLLENVSEGVLGTFDGSSEKLNCSLGGSGEGDLEGSLLLTSTEGIMAVS